MLYYLSETGTPHILVATKADKLNATETKAFRAFIEEDVSTRGLDMILCSAKNGLGNNELWQRILGAAKL